MSEGVGVGLPSKHDRLGVEVSPQLPRQLVCPTGPYAVESRSLSPVETCRQIDSGVKVLGDVRVRLNIHRLWLLWTK